MKGGHQHHGGGGGGGGGGAGEVLTAAVTAGATSMDGAQLPGGSGSSSATVAHAHPARRDGGWFAQWKKLLGLATFMATAHSAGSGGGGGLAGRRRGNPFSRGIVTNCRDFWCDPAPVFRPRETGAAFLDGEVVNYARMYEPPLRMSRGRPGSRYEAVSAEEELA